MEKKIELNKSVPENHNNDIIKIYMSKYETRNHLYFCIRCKTCLDIVFS